MLFNGSHTTPESAEAEALAAGSPPWVKAIQSALRKQKFADAVRLLLKLIDDGVFPRDRAWPTLQHLLGVEQSAQILQACAEFPCPMCDAGVLTCTTCEGQGDNESVACMKCRSLGTVTCDFCAGSGLAGYGFFPRGLQPRIAALRLARAMHFGQDTPDDAATFDQLLETYRQLSRSRAMLNNSLEMCSASGNAVPELIPHLVVQCWRGLAAVETVMGQHAARMAAVAAASAEADPTENHFHKERKHLLDEEAAQLLASAQDRTLRMRQCSRRGA